MAYEISDLTGTVIAPSSTYPYGDVKDQPSGTLMNRKFIADLMQFSQRIMAKSGVSPNSLPDNADNGFQLVQALNKLINEESEGMAKAFGSVAGANVAMLMGGMAATIVGTTTTIAAGWFYYNAQYVKFLQSSYLNSPAPGPGTAVMVVIATIDGIPTATVQITTNTTTSARFKLIDMIQWSESVGIDALQADISTLNTEVAIGAWTTLPLGSNWSAVNSCQYRKDGMGRIYLRGQIQAAGGATIVLATLPAGSRPAQNMIVPVFTNSSITPQVGTVTISASSGEIRAGVFSTSPTINTGDLWNFDGVVFLNS